MKVCAQSRCSVCVCVCVCVCACVCGGVGCNGEATAVTLAIWVPAQHSSTSPAAPTATSCPPRPREGKGTPGNQSPHLGLLRGGESEYRPTSPFLHPQKRGAVYTPTPWPPTGTKDTLTLPSSHGLQQKGFGAVSSSPCRNNHSVCQQTLTPKTVDLTPEDFQNIKIY